MVREENGVLNNLAGIEFIYQMIEIVKSKNPIFLFCGNAQSGRKKCMMKKLFGDFIISDQISEVRKFIRF
jgi:hypothetical protein